MRLRHLFAEQTVTRPIALGRAAFCMAGLFAVASADTLLAAAPQQAPGRPAHAAGLKPPPHAQKGTQTPMVIRDQGGRSFAGTILGDFATRSVHCDHGYVEYQIPLNPRKLAMLMVHSASTQTWEKTFAGDDGYKNIFLRRGFSVYITDAPRVGRAGWGCREWTYKPDLGRDQAQVTSWRLGIWLPPAPPQFFPGVQFPVNDFAIDQVLRARYPEFDEPEDVQLETSALATLLKDIGPAIMITHSGSGVRGWWTRLKSENVKAIIAYEPVDFIAPQGEIWAPNPPGRRPPEAVPLAEFNKLTRIPIQIIYGDNIAATPTGIGGRDIWVEAKANARDFVAAINRHGGDAEVLVLPDVGIYGNTHFPMSDLNNLQIANLLSQYLHQKGLDRRK